MNPLANTPHTTGDNPPKTIDDVIMALDGIIAECLVQQSTLGYFAALYQKVTKQVKHGIDEGIFDDGLRMEKLDVIFACRYIDAYYEHKNGVQPSKSWQLAFSISGDYWPIVLQHLLIGMNAHINLDLGISAAQTMKGGDINELKNDFDRINKVLSNLVEEVEQNLAAIWPTLYKLLKLAGNIDNLLADFSMALARDGAWRFATQLAASEDNTSWHGHIATKDRNVAKVGKLVINPPLVAAAGFKVIRMGERGTVVDKINVLNG